MRRKRGGGGKREEEERSENSLAGFLLIQHCCLLKPIRTGDSAGAMIDGKWGRGDQSAALLRT